MIRTVGFHLAFIVLIIMSLEITFPSYSHAETWGNGSGTVDEMLEKEETESANKNNETLDEKDDSSPTTAEQDIPATENSQNLFLLSLQMFAALAFVIFLIYALLRFVNQRSKSFNEHRTMESIGGVGLGSNRSVQIIRVGDKLYLIGVGENVQMLKEITDGDEVNRILDDHRQQQDVTNQPVVKLTGWIKDRVTTKATTSEKGFAFHQLLDRELREVQETQVKVHAAIKEKEK